MKREIIATTITVLFSTMATANSGLADRINEERSYPNKEVSTKMIGSQDKKIHEKVSKLSTNRSSNA